MSRAFRGLALGLSLSAINLAGAAVALWSFGGFSGWSQAQFIGLFGVLEIATGAVSIFGPNIWRLPVAQAQTSPRTDVRLALSTILIPHLAASAKLIAGLAMVVYALAEEGASPASAGLVALSGLLAIAISAGTLALARIGVEWPTVDVWSLTIHRAGHEDLPLPAFSLTSLLALFLINIGIFPAVKLLPPGVLYQPEMAPSAAVLAWTGAIAVALVAGALAAWHGRLSLRAPREQQREAEAAAAGAVGDISAGREASAS